MEKKPAGKPIDLQNNLMHYFQTQIIGFVAKSQRADLGNLVSGRIEEKPGLDYVVYHLEYQIRDVDRVTYHITAKMFNSQAVEIVSI